MLGNILLLPCLPPGSLPALSPLLQNQPLLCPPGPSLGSDQGTGSPLASLLQSLQVGFWGGGMRGKEGWRGPVTSGGDDGHVGVVGPGSSL